MPHPRSGRASPVVKPRSQQSRMPCSPAQAVLCIAPVATPQPLFGCGHEPILSPVVLRPLAVLSLVAGLLEVLHQGELLVFGEGGDMSQNTLIKRACHNL